MTTKSEAARLADALERLHDYKQPYPSGPHGQQIGMESYRLLATGAAFGDMIEAAAMLRQWPDAAAQEPVAWREHVEQRIRTWRQSTMNRSGDRLAIDDFMGQDSIDDLVDFVCDVYAAPPAAQPAGMVLVPRNPDIAWFRRECVAAGLWPAHDVDGVPSAFIEAARKHHAAMIAASPAQPAAPAVEPLTDESAWLIEWQAHGHGPQWWGFNHTPGLFSDWCSDANNAIRFSRKEDAERMRLHVIAVAGFSGRLDYQRQVTVTEHMWPAAHGITQGEQHG